MGLTSADYPNAAVPEASPKLMNDPRWEIFWRLTRAAIVTAFMQTLAMDINWTDPEQAFKVIAMSLGTGFILAFGKALRENYGDPDKSSGLINKLPF